MSSATPVESSFAHEPARPECAGPPDSVAGTPVTSAYEITRAGSWAELRYLLAGDLCRYKGARGLRGGLRVYVYRPGFRVTFWMRMAAYLSRKPLLRPFYYVAELLRMHGAIKYGISIPHEVAIGPGLYIGHIGGIVVNDAVRIGRNCNLSHGVTLGQANRGARKGCPTIGDAVYIGPGAKIIGKVCIGSNVAVGANAVVTHDVKDNEVVGGIPARTLSTKGADGYVTWTFDQPPPARQC